MANDPGLLSDTLTYMEAVAGDGGVHDPSGVWWLSPDIVLTGPVSGADKADPGNNTVDVSFHGSMNGSLPSGTESITIDLFVANPSLAMAPNNSQSTVRIDSVGMPLLTPGQTQTYQFTWAVPAGLTGTNPQAPGHKCLIARCYADPLYPSSTDFFVPGDRHVGQRNICIVPCGAPGAAKRPAGCGTSVRTINPDGKKAQKTKLRARVDLELTKPVRAIVLKALEHTRGYKSLAAKAPRGIQFQLKDVKGKATSKTGAKPVCEADLVLEPGQVIDFGFVADLSGGKLGEAHVCHLTQEGPDGRPQGGLTVVLLAI